MYIESFHRLQELKISVGAQNWTKAGISVNMLQARGSLIVATCFCVPDVEDGCVAKELIMDCSTVNSF